MELVLNTYSGCIGLGFKHRSRKILDSKITTGFNQRNILDICSSKPSLECLPYIERIDQSSHNHYSVCFCMMMEKVSEIKTPETVDAIRVILLELERIYSHTNYIHDLVSHIQDDLLDNILTDMRFYITDCFEELIGHRMYGNPHIFGGISFNLSPGNIKSIVKTLNYLEPRIAEVEEILSNSKSSLSLYKGLADLNKISSNLTGPISWAESTLSDLRISDPYLMYGNEEIKKMLMQRGQPSSNIYCSYERIFTIIRDTKCSLGIINYLIEKYNPVSKEGYHLISPVLKSKRVARGKIETPRGVLSMRAEVSKTGKISSLSIKSASEQNAEYLPTLLKGVMLDYLEIAYKSFYISAMEIDR